VPDFESIAAAFRRFAEVELQGHDTLTYERLAAAIARDPQLLEIASHCPPTQPKPNLFFGAVQYLLALQPEHPLASHYPAISNGPPIGNLVTDFAGFCRSNRQAIVAILQSRLVQTNEVGRSALLLPAFYEAFRQGRAAPLALLEIGPSAGLNLLFDHYAADYGGQRAGDPNSPLVLHCDSHGAPLPLQGSLPRVASRIGIDLNPLDPRNEDDMRWLRALIWPEHHDRRAQLAAAIAIAGEHPPALLRGDVFELLPRELEAVTSGHLPVVFATFVLNQFSEEMRQRLRVLLMEHASRRELAVVVLGGTEFVTGVREPHADTSLWLLWLTPDARRASHLARCHPHGRWIRWAPGHQSLPWLDGGTIGG
jgi:hypothetical protein